MDLRGGFEISSCQLWNSTFALLSHASSGDLFAGASGSYFGTGALTINLSSAFVKWVVLCFHVLSQAKDMIWRHDLFNDSMVAAGLSGVETGTKLYISNLDYGVSNEDIKELFSEVGELKRWAVHYDRNGRPSGSAEVVFTRRSDAIAALKRYNNVQLDGKTMKIEVIGMNLGLPVTPRVNVVGGTNGRGKRTVVMTPEFGRGGGSSSNRSSGWNRGGFQRGRGRARGSGFQRGRGRGHGRGRKQTVEKSAEQLDKELDNYHADAMNTS
uniref:RRM domain-containing protein n=1 Tax=Ananas comosus var. bracteatus TaxID=296719 RepID=A0A6V7P7B2_ANACO|nr:unnamed protein product [Ananas comosus var. bracteatus]